MHGDLVWIAPENCVPVYLHRYCNVTLGRVVGTVHWLFNRTVTVHNAATVAISFSHWGRAERKVSKNSPCQFRKSFWKFSPQKIIIAKNINNWSKDNTNLISYYTCTCTHCLLTARFKKAYTHTHKSHTFVTPVGIGMIREVSLGFERNGHVPVFSFFIQPGPSR